MVMQVGLNFKYEIFQSVNQEAYSGGDRRPFLPQPRLGGVKRLMSEFAPAATRKTTRGGRVAGGI